MPVGVCLRKLAYSVAVSDPSCGAGAVLAHNLFGVVDKMAFRNPRRAYERDGTMIVPPTVGEARAEGETTAAASCNACGHEAIVSTDGMPAELPFPDVALRLRCRCGSKAIQVRKDMLAHYQRMRDDWGWSAG